MKVSKIQTETYEILWKNIISANIMSSNNNKLLYIGACDHIQPVRDLRIFFNTGYVPDKEYFDFFIQFYEFCEEYNDTCCCEYSDE
jgi:hypothetical protein